MPKKFGTPGPRALHPVIATDRPLSRTSIGAQLLFDRLIVNSDDQGRQQGDPDLVKHGCLPLVKGATPKAITRWLDELEAQGLILLYAIDDNPLVQIRGWWKYNDHQRWIYPSRWPPPSEWLEEREPKIPGSPSGGAVPASREQGASGPPASASASADASDGASAFALPGSVPAGHTPEGHNISEASRIPEYRLSDAHKAYVALTGTPEPKKIRDWIEDACRKYDRSPVIAAMYETPDPTVYGWWGRVFDKLRRG